MKVKRKLATIWPILGLLAGCSWVPNAVNPVSWYRDLSGASKNDKLDTDQRNQQNFESGGKGPYPNLADVPNAPDRAISRIDRDALQKSLAADRSNARYTDEQLRAGTAAPGAVAPPPPGPLAGVNAPLPAAAPGPRAAAAVQQQDAALPKESPLVSPSIANVPQGEMPAPAPPPAELPPLPNQAAESSQVASAAPGAGVAGSGKRRAAAASSVHALSVVFADGSAALPDAERNRLSEVAAAQHQQGGAVRVIGHALPATGADAAQQPLASFTLALNRARAVAKVLNEDGVPSQSIAVETAPNHAGDATGANAEVFLEH
ncbi:MAG TPA: OmpA family protein [Stellaceae bacterium]|nr:OmpA family protein [Stellaceae bacterium]